jgi:DNA-binding PadR family transcriptional regulator
MARKIDKELIEAILSELADGNKTGYEIYKALKKSGRKVSSRIVYHYLYLALKEGKVTVENKNEIGNFSWGNTVNKRYYKVK